MGKYGTKLDYCSSKEVPCTGQPSVHSLSAVLELTLGRLQSPPILLLPYSNTDFYAAMEPYLRALKGRVTWRRGDEIWGEKLNRKLKGVMSLNMAHFKKLSQAVQQRWYHSNVVIYSPSRPGEFWDQIGEESDYCFVIIYCLLMIIALFIYCLLMKVVYWWKLSIDESRLLMKVVYL